MSQRQTRSSTAGPAGGSKAKSQAPKAPKGGKRATTSSHKSDDVVTMSAAERKQLEELQAKLKLVEQQKSNARKHDIRKRSAQMVMDDVSEGDEEERVQKKAKYHRRVESSDEDGQVGSRESTEEQAGNDARPSDIEEPERSQRTGRPRPKPAFKGAPNKRAVIEKQAEVPADREDERLDEDDDEMEDGERELALAITGRGARKPAPTTSNNTARSAAAKGKANANPEPSEPSGTGESQTRARRSSKSDRQIVSHVEILSPSSKSKKAAPPASSKTSNQKKAWDAPLTDDDDEEGGTEAGQDNDDEESGEAEDLDGDDDIVLVEDKQGSSKDKARRGRKSGKRNRNRALATNLPEGISPIKNMAASYLRMYIALEAAWTKYTAMNNSRLLHRHDVMEAVMQSVREHRDKDGRHPADLKAAYNVMLEAGNDDVRKTLTEVIWQGASQTRNDLKKKAKQIVEESYGFMGLKAQKQQALATWLSTSHRMKLGSGAFVNVPNFIFPLEEVVWQDGRGGKGNRVDEEKTQIKQNRRMPFQHPAVSRLIYVFWFAGQSYAEVKVRREKFSCMPDNLIALVCNALEAALKDYLQASANNPLDLQFSNKIYAPKWDDHMSLLEEIARLSPDGYRSMKTLVWGRVNTRIKEDEKVRGVDQLSGLSNPALDIPFHDLAVDEVPAEDHESEPEVDELEHSSRAGSQQLLPGTSDAGSVPASVLGPVVDNEQGGENVGVNDPQATTQAPQKKGASAPRSSTAPPVTTALRAVPSISAGAPQTSTSKPASSGDGPGVEKPSDSEATAPAATASVAKSSAPMA